MLLLLFTALAVPYYCTHTLRPFCCIIRPGILTYCTTALLCCACSIMYCCAVLHLQHHVLLGCAASAAPCTAALCCVCSTMYCCTMLRLQHHVQLRCAVQPLLCLLAASSAPQMANMGQIGRAARYYTDPSPHHGLSLLTWSTCESGGGSLDPEPGAHVSHRGAPGRSPTFCHSASRP